MHRQLVKKVIYLRQCILVLNGNPIKHSVLYIQSSLASDGVITYVALVQTIEWRRKNINLYYPNTNWMQVIPPRSRKKWVYPKVLLPIKKKSTDVIILFHNILLESFWYNEIDKSRLWYQLVTIQIVVIGIHTNHSMGEPLLQPKLRN